MKDDPWDEDGGPAFPITVQNGNTGFITYKGLTVRDWFAGQALAGLLANTNISCPYSQAAEEAYRAADAMIAMGKEDAE